jgi:hydrogenase nickel incorporation protein HypB
MTTRILEVRQGVLKKNDLLAHDLRRRFAAAGVFVVNLVSSPGAGKTSLLETTLTQLGRNHRVGALVGDLATDRDAQRLARSGARVQQIVTGTICHLDAEMLDKALADWDLAALDLLFVENVGNLVCPSSYDLGEALRVVLMAVTEGEDKPLKYPTIYNSADLAVITKIDLADAVGFAHAEAHGNIQAVRPGMPILETSARTGQGLDSWLAALTTRAATASAAAATAANV